MTTAHATIPRLIWSVLDEVEITPPSLRVVAESLRGKDTLVYEVLVVRVDAEVLHLHELYDK